MSDLIQVDEEVDALSEAQLTNCLLRALNKVKADYVLENGEPVLVDSEDVVLSTEFASAFEKELVLASAAQITSRLLVRGAILSDGIDSNGHIKFIPNPEFQEGNHAD